MNGAQARPPVPGLGAAQAATSAATAERSSVSELTARVQEGMRRLMEMRRMDQRRLAQALGVSDARVAHLLGRVAREAPNGMTLRMLEDVAAACGAEVKIEFVMKNNEDIDARMAEIAESVTKKIRTCHERVACPKCRAPVGVRCVRAGTYERYGTFPRERTLKNPHDERWNQEVPPR